MGFLFSKLLNLFSNEEHKIIIVGLDNAGKILNETIVLVKIY